MTGSDTRKARFPASTTSTPEQTRCDAHCRLTCHEQTKQAPVVVLAQVDLPQVYVLPSLFGLELAEKCLQRPGFAYAGLTIVGVLPDECLPVPFLAVNADRYTIPQRLARAGDQDWVLRNPESQSNPQVFVHHRVEATRPEKLRGSKKSTP